MFEEYLVNGKDAFCVFMNLENTYNTIDRHGMYQKLRGWCGARGECKGAWERAGTAECEW